MHKVMPPKKNAAKRLRCLAVEDNDINLEVLMLLLEPFNLDTTIAP